MKKTIISILAFSMVLGMNAAHAEDADAKLQQLQQALALKPDDIMLLDETAVALYQAGKYSEAEPLVQRGLAIREKALGKAHPAVAASLDMLALLYKEQGKYNETEPLYQHSLAIKEKALGKSHPDVAASLNYLSLLYKEQGKYSEAEPLFQRSLAINEKSLGKDHPEVATSLNNLAVLYRHQGKYSEAEPLYQRSLAIREKTLGKDHPDVAMSLNDLAGLYHTQGKYSEAEPLFQRSLAIYEKVLGKDHRAVATSLNNLAELYQVQGKYSEAEPLFQRSLAINEKALGKDHPEVATSLNNLASLYQALGKYSEAEPLYQRSLAIVEKALGKDHPDVAGSLNNLAFLYQAQGKYSEAEPLYQRSLAIFEKALGKDHPDVADSLDNLAMLYAAQGKLNKSKTLLQRSLRITNQSLDHWLWGAGEKTRQSYLQKEEGMRNVYLSFYNLANTPEEAFYFSLSRKGLLLRISSEMNALAKQSSNPEIQKQTQEFNALKSQLASLAFSGKAEDKAKIQALEEQSNTLEMQLSQKVASFKRAKTEVTPKEVLAKLSPKQSLVDFLVYKERDLKTNTDKPEQVIALVADKKNGIKLIKLGELAPISEAIKTYRQNILPNAQGQLANREDVLKPASQKLYQLIWQPLLPYLANKKQVYLIPDGILHLLPFKALQDKQGHYLAEQQQITLLSSARDIVLPPLEGKTGDSVIFAAPVFGEKEDKTANTSTRSVVVNRQDLHFYPLEGAAAEGKALSDLIKTKQSVQVFQDKQATETAVDAIKAPRFLHFATHGFFLENLPPPASEKPEMQGLMQNSPKNLQLTENPLTRSGLALTNANFGIQGKKQADGTDGILTALEVLGLHLEGTDLVTLSACETGVGDIQVGEGVYSLNRAFQEAGAKSVLSTLWSVADDQTKLFMQNFYTLVLNGESPQQALQKTQLKFINDKTLKDPFFWAAFTVVGI